MKTAVTQLIERLKNDWNIVLSDNVVEFYLREEQEQIRNKLIDAFEKTKTKNEKEIEVIGNIHENPGLIIMNPEQYWRTRCELAEECLDQSPCDPDITSGQIEANNAYRNFISNNNES